MAGGGAEPGPYGAAVQLHSWAAAYPHYLRGRLILAGLDPDRLALRDYLAIVYALLVDSADANANKAEVLEKLDKALAEPLGANPLAPNREEWGTGPEAEAGHRAMIALSGGPAPLRSPGQRPEPSTLTP